MTGKPIEVLLVEDDPADADLTKETLKDGKLFVHLNVVEDGEQAMAYLRQQSPFENAVRPDLVLLDLNLPRLDGRQVLKEIKEDDSLKTIPVVVLTTSEAETDVQNMYRIGANCYITKPIGMDEFSIIVRTLEDFWFSVVRLPSEG